MNTEKQKLKHAHFERTHVKREKITGKRVNTFQEDDLFVLVILDFSVMILFHFPVAVRLLILQKEASRNSLRNSTESSHLNIELRLRTCKSDLVSVDSFTTE